MERRKPTPKQIADRLGGADDPDQYRRIPDPHYSQQTSHRKRSIANDPRKDSPRRRPFTPN